MSIVAVENLTSAEAGFLYVAADKGGIDSRSWLVDETTAAPLAKILSSEYTTFEADREVLENARFDPGKNRTPGDLSWALRSPELLRMRRCLMASGGDRSVRSPDFFDLRRWLDDQGERTLGERLVVFGGGLVGMLKRRETRRRLATLMSRLPDPVKRDIEARMVVFSEVDEVVDDAMERRIYEVYCDVAGEGLQADEMLAMVGLFFVVNAVVFRQNAELDRFEAELGGSLLSRCQHYRISSIGSERSAFSDSLIGVLGAFYRGGIEASEEERR